MTIIEVNKLMSSEVKAKLIVHFINCNCNNCDASSIIKKLNVFQPTFSKHVNKLLKLQVLQVRQEGKKRYYGIDLKWKAAWQAVIDPMVNHQTYKNLACLCPKGATHKNN